MHSIIPILLLLSGCANKITFEPTAIETSGPCESENAIIQDNWSAVIVDDCMSIRFNVPVDGIIIRVGRALSSTCDDNVYSGPDVAGSAVLFAGERWVSTVQVAGNSWTTYGTSTGGYVSDTWYICRPDNTPFITVDSVDYLQPL